MDTTANYELVIEAGKSEGQYWRDFWRYRELFYFLAWRDVLVRYKQTVIGILWSVIRPLLTTIVFTFAFSHVAKLPSSGEPYPVLVYAGMLPWQFFSNSLTDSSNSLIANANMISKVYFPRMIVPTSTVISALVDYLISVVILFVMMAIYRCPLHWTILWLPILTIFVAAASVGPGLLLAALNVKYRDFRFIVPFIVQFGLFLSPVGFSAKAVHGKWAIAYALNPMVGVIDGFRYAVFGKAFTPGIFPIVSSLVLIAALLIIGVSYFRRTERSFADVI